MTEDDRYSFRHVFLAAFGIGTRPASPMIRQEELEEKARSDPALRAPYERWMRNRFWVRVVRVQSLVAFALMGAYTVLIIRGPATGGSSVVPLMVLTNLAYTAISRFTRNKLAASGAERIKDDLLLLGRCPGCGYDLTGLPGVGDGSAIVCPECAAIWSRKPQSKTGRP